MADLYFVKDEDTLRKHLPNAFATAEGETSLYDKLAPHLEQSQTWLIWNILGFGALVTILEESSKYSSQIEICSNIIVNDALINAIPKLDLVLTPNGFGVVSNSNVAPASKERIERLIASCEKERDHWLELLLRAFDEMDIWYEDTTGEFFSATLFPDFSLCKALGITEHLWDNYQKYRAEIIPIEQKIANEYISPELMAAFRDDAVHHFNKFDYDETKPARRFLINTLRFHEIAVLQGRPLNHEAMADIVNIIRNDPDTYPEWQNTATAALFSPNKFENSKDSSGFWFG